MSTPPSTERQAGMPSPQGSQATSAIPIDLSGAALLPRQSLSPQRVLLVLVGGIFLSEVVEMLLVEWLASLVPLSHTVEIVLDALIMVVIAFPMIYYLAFRNLLRQVEERKRSEALLSNVLESLPVGVWITNIKGDVVHGNRASQEIWAGAAYVGKEEYGTYKAWWPDSGKPVAPDEWAASRVLASGQAILDDEVEIEGFDGRRKTILNSAVPIFDKGAIQGAIVVNQDITAHKQAEALLAQQNRDLEALRLAESRQRQVAETLNEVSRTLSQSLDFAKVLDTLVDFVMRLVPLDYAYIVIIENEVNLRLYTRRGYEGDSEAKLEMGEAVKLGDYAYLQQVILNCQSLLIADTGAFPGWETLITRSSVGSWLGIPLAAGGQAIGVLALQKVHPNFFTLEHLSLAEGISAQAAVAIQNAWLYEEVRSGHHRLQSLSRRLVEVQEGERRAIARELHDEASQSLTALKVGLSLVEKEIETPESLLVHLAELKQLADNIMEALHRLAMGLRPASLDYLGLVVALEQLVKENDRRYDMDVHFKAVNFPPEVRLPDTVEISVYRVVQEALTNAARHANARNIDVILEYRAEKIVLLVEDNGIGFNLSQVPQTGHLGLIGMQERAQMIGATLHIESEPGCGTIIVMEVPHDN